MPKFTRKERDAWDTLPGKERRIPKLMRRMLRQPAPSLPSDCAVHRPTPDDNWSCSSERSMCSGASTKPPPHTSPPRRTKARREKLKINWQLRKKNMKKEKEIINEMNEIIIFNFSAHEQDERNKILKDYLISSFYFSKGDHSILDEAEKIHFNFEIMDDLESVKTGKKYCDKNDD